MVSLFLLTFFHMLRSKLLVAIVLFTFVVQYLGLKIARATTLYIQGKMPMLVGDSEGIYVGVVLLMFLGGFVAVAYGLWIVPYLHRGQRKELIYVLPVSKWSFPLVYAICLSALLLLQHVIFLFCNGWVFGEFIPADFPWIGFCLSFLIQIIAGLGFMFAFATGSLALGALPTLFLGLAALFVLTAGGALFRFNIPDVLGEAPAWFDWGRRLFELLPPVGELPMILRTSLFGSTYNMEVLGISVIWLAFFVLLFRYKLNFPLMGRGSL